MLRGSLCVALAALATVVMTVPAAAGTKDTTANTIVGDERDGLLTRGSGERHVVREDLAQRTTKKRGDNLLFLAQMSDTHVLDEESPLRVEFTDKLGLIFTSAYRPQESASPQVLEQMVGQLRNQTSPVTGRRLDLVMTTGDNTDNAQCNEARWMIDIMSGNGIVDPDSGVAPGTPLRARDLCLAGDPERPVVAPLAPGCDPTATGRRYDGVRGGDYYEPDGGGDPAYEGVRDFPGFLEKANTPFRTTGFRDDVPWYAVFGNHDGLLQGNQPRNPAFEAIGVGCVKVTGLSATDLEAIQNAPDRDTAMARAAQALTSSSGLTGPGVKLIQPDPRRRPLKKDEWIAEHIKDAPDYGHGFGPDNLASGMGNYVLEPGNRLRFVALDTISEHGLEEGNIDDGQFRWLHQQLAEADERGLRVVLFAHHSLRTMGQPPVSPFLPGDMGGSLDPNVHFGEGPRNLPVKLPCLTADPAAPTYPTETLRCLALRHPSVVAFVNGHEHANRIDPVRYEGNDPAQREDRGFWEINTASHIDFPQQSRVLDILDNPDGTLSIFTTMVDHDSSPNPGSAPATADPKRLASISREISWTEPQSGREGPRGSREDRNAELVVRDPAERD